MNATLLVTASSASATEVTEITSKVCTTIKVKAKIGSKVSDSVATTGAKEPIALGTIALTFITSGAAVAMFEALRSYFDRTPSLELEFKKEKNRESLVIRAKHMRGDEFDKSVAMARAFFED